MKRPLAAALLLAITTAIAADAHHSFARYYYEDRSVSIEGEVFELQFRSPHTWVYVMTEDEDGHMQVIAAEWVNANRLGREGVTEDTFRPGDRVLLSGHPSRDPSEHKIHLQGITRLSDGLSWKGRERR